MTDACEAETSPDGAPTAPVAAPHTGQARLLRRIGWLAVLAVTVGSLWVAATTERTPATDAERAYLLKERTLCPVCDGQSVLESNAPVAGSIRRQIDAWVDEGLADALIAQRLAEVYGDEVNALPPAVGLGSLIWIVPVAVALLAAALVGRAVARWRSRPDPSHDIPSALPADGMSPAQPARAGPDGAVRVGAVGDDGIGDVSRATTARAAHAARPVRAVRTRQIIAAGIVLAVGSAAGIGVAQFSGLREPGATLTGDVDASARSLAARAQRLFVAGDASAARQTVDEALRADPDLVAGLLLRSRLHEDDGAIVAALADLDRVLDARPGHTEALGRRGWILVRVGVDDPELAAYGIAALDRALAADPPAFDIWVYRGYAARYVEGDLAGAIAYYTSALHRSPPPQMQTQLDAAIAEMTAQLAAAASAQEPE